jgi:hypothetical protein
LNRDPLWQEIKNAINGTVNPLAFERAMQDLLRDVYPDLVPVVGGSDSGMDGSLPSNEGMFPLICTTGQDVLGNFRRSITAHLKKRKGPARCVLVTSQALTPPRRENIREAAGALGVNIVQIHDQEDIVGRLYSNDRWRKELLGVSGRPSALSRFPLRHRSTTADMVVGREVDLAWIDTRPQDLLVVGAPGSGKTYLHQHLAEQGKCLFMIEDELEALANAIRAQKPTIIVIDDAHVDSHRIEALRHLRQTIGVDFCIHANCWPGPEYEKDVVARLGISETQIRLLRPLKPKQIRDLIARLGLVGPDFLLDIIIKQAHGKPGLAAVLVSACKADTIGRVWSGEALADTLLHGCKICKDATDREILAHFALGGRSGADATAVADNLGITQVELRRRVSVMGAGGIIHTNGDNVLCVRPPELHGVLVRDVFYQGLLRAPIEGAFKAIRDFDDCTSVLMSAKQRGAEVQLSELERRVAGSLRHGLWEHFAFVDSAAADLVLSKYPETTCVAAEGLLHFRPASALLALLEIAQSGTETDLSLARHPQKRIQEWLNPWDEIELTAGRRVELLNVIETHCARGTLDATKMLPFLGMIIDPNVSGMHSAPGESRTITFRNGVYGGDTVRSLSALWPRVCNLLGQVPGREWAPLINIVENWVWPGRGSHKVSEDQAVSMIEFGGRMLQNLVDLPTCTNGPRHRILRTAKFKKLNVTAHEDALFARIFSDRDHDAGDGELRRKAELDLVVQELHAMDVSQCIVTLVRFEAEYAGFREVRGGSDRGRIYHLLAGLVSEPVRWMREFSEASFPFWFLNSFLLRVLKESPASKEPELERLLKMPIYKEEAIAIVVQSEGWSDRFVEEAYASIVCPQPGSSIDHRLSMANMPIAHRRRLLNHSIEKIRLAAALGEWNGQANHDIRSEILEPWGDAIVEIGYGDNQYHLEAIFARYPTLAIRWVERQLTSPAYGLWGVAQGMAYATKVLDKLSRSRLLARIVSPDLYNEECFDALVGGDVDVFREWIRNTHGDWLRSKPLGREPSAWWEMLAVTAMDEGLLPEAIADRIDGLMVSFSGDDPSEAWIAKENLYRQLTLHADARFHVIGHRGMEWARNCLARERQRLEIDDYR